MVARRELVRSKREIVLTAPQQEAAESELLPTVSHVASQEPQTTTDDQIGQKLPAPVFPFSSSHAAFRKETILARLPALSEAETIVNAYYRYFAFQYVSLSSPHPELTNSYDVAPREMFMPIFNRIYDPLNQQTSPMTKIQLQELALLFAILAMGVRYGLELPMDDPSGPEFFTLAKTCLSRGDFLTYNTITGVQTLVSRFSTASTDSTACNGPLPTVSTAASPTDNEGKWKRNLAVTRLGLCGGCLCASSRL